MKRKHHETQHHTLGKTALLVVDVQREYWSSENGTAVRTSFPQFEERMARLLKWARSPSSGVSKVVHILAHYDNDRTPFADTYKIFHPEKTFYVPNPQCEPFAAPKDGELVVEKTTFDAFYCTNLADMLRRNRIETVLIGGLITSVCVQFTAHGAFARGFFPILVEDACADRSQETHDGAIRIYGDYIYRLVTTSQLQAAGLKPSVSHDDLPCGLAKSPSANSVADLSLVDDRHSECHFSATAADTSSSSASEDESDSASLDLADEKASPAALVLDVWTQRGEKHPRTVSLGEIDNVAF